MNHAGKVSLTQNSLLRRITVFFQLGKDVWDWKTFFIFICLVPNEFRLIELSLLGSDSDTSIREEKGRQIPLNVKHKCFNVFKCGEVVVIYGAKKIIIFLFTIQEIHVKIFLDMSSKTFFSLGTCNNLT